MKPVILRCFVGIIICLLFLSPNALAESDKIRKGIAEFNQENYEEAIQWLTESRDQDPESPLAAYMLGLSHKKAMNYEKAVLHLTDAVRLKPHIKEALVELIDCHLLLSGPEDLKKAAQWIGVAETEGIFQGQVAFLKGRLLKKTGASDEAVSAFETAKTLNPDLARTADFEIAMIRIEQNKLNDAGILLEKVMEKDPESDLSVFARNYHRMVEDRLFFERPWRFTLTALGQYDTNMVLKPTDSSAAESVTDEEGFAGTGSIRVEYVPEIEGPLMFYARYSGLINVHENHSRTHDLIGNSLKVQPGYSWGNVSAHLNFQADHYLRRNPDYEGYLTQLTAGPQARLFLSDAHILEVSGGYRNKQYDESPELSEENRDADGLNASLNWIWRINNDWFFNAQYEFSREDARGVNWENSGHRFSMSTAYAFTDSIRMQLGLDSLLQFYDEPHTVFDRKREDHTNMGTAGLIWDLNRHFSLLFQYSRIRCNSNIGIYDYTRDLVSAGFELRY